MLSFFPRGVLDEILNLIESVSEDFPSYSTWLTGINTIIADGQISANSPFVEQFLHILADKCGSCDHNLHVIM